MATINAINNASNPFTVTAGDLTASAIRLPATTSAYGFIQINAVRVVNSYSSTSFFMGTGAGSTTGTGGNNSGYGANSLTAFTTTTNNACLGRGTGADLTASGSSGNCLFGYNTGVAMTLSASTMALGAEAVKVATTNPAWSCIIGYRACYAAVNPYSMQAVGQYALGQVTTGAQYNVAVGDYAGYALTSGEDGNVYIGAQVQGVAGENNVLRAGCAVNGDYGISSAYIFGIDSVAVGATAGAVLADSVSQIGSISGATGTMFLGNTKPEWNATVTVTTNYATTFDTNVAAAKVTIAGTTVTAAGTDANTSVTITPKGAGTIVSTAVYNKAVGITNRAMLVDDSGLIGNATSSRRFKDNIADMDDSSGPILDLSPVTFVYCGDPYKREKFGLIAEEVAEVIPSLVSYDENRAPHSVNYHELPAMLLNELHILMKRIAYLEAKLETNPR